MPNLERLPTANNRFEDLRRSNQIYVDHTDLLYEIVRFKRPSFLSRPRRFGKSLLISAIESLFKHGTEYFRGLKIEPAWSSLEKDNRYKVIRLDFSSLIYSCRQEFDYVLCKRLRDVIKTEEISVREILPEDNAGDILFKIIADNKSQVVLLIDEYDYPLTHSLGDEALFDDYRKYIQGLFGAIKDLTGDLRFVFISGVGRFAKTSVFSQLNNLRDLGLESDFSTLLGYTDEDIHQYFNEYVENAADILKITTDECYRLIKAHYDGYRFHVNNETTLYNPWSVLNFLSAPKNGFRNFWYETGGAYPTLIAKYIKSIQDTPLETLQKVRIIEDDLNLFYDYFDVPTVSLLYQTGYLTLTEEYDEKLAITWLNLCPPNFEVKSALSKLYLLKVREQPLSVEDVRTAAALSTDFRSQNYENLIKHFNVILNSFGFDNKVAFTDERNCRDFIDLALNVAGIISRKEILSAKGRADLAVEQDEFRFVFEFKLARDKSSEEKLLIEAEEQLNDKVYGEIVPFKTTIKIPVVISAQNKAVALWKVIS
ncbi:MAG: AAA family ATPase [Succinivibrio sp.]|nr:AAA family ATPase [Succinivibrio sp.]